MQKGTTVEAKTVRTSVAVVTRLYSLSLNPQEITRETPANTVGLGLKEKIKKKIGAIKKYVSCVL